MEPDKLIITYKCKCGEYNVEESQEEFYTNRLLVGCPDCREDMILLGICRKEDK